MTLEEAIQRAKQGDVGAMCSLGEYYFIQNTGESIEEATKWYEMAARNNVLYAVNVTVALKTMSALAGLQIVDDSEMAWEFVKRDWEEVYDWSSREMRMLDDGAPGSEAIDRNKAIKSHKDATYYLALSNYQLGNDQAVVTLLKDNYEKRAKILYGSALFNMANYDDEYEYSIQQLKFIDGDIEYGSAEKTRYEEKVYAVTALTLSRLYKEGLAEKGRPRNLEKAVQLLNFTRAYLTNVGWKELIDEELQHYQKKMFGGYKYI